MRLRIYIILKWASIVCENLYRFKNPSYLLLLRNWLSKFNGKSKKIDIRLSRNYLFKLVIKLQVSCSDWVSETLSTRKNTRVFYYFEILLYIFALSIKKSDVERQIPFSNDNPSKYIANSHVFDKSFSRIKVNRKKRRTRILIYHLIKLIIIFSFVRM